MWQHLLYFVLSIALHFLFQRLGKTIVGIHSVDLSDFDDENIRRNARSANRWGTGLTWVAFLTLAPAWIWGSFVLDYMTRASLPHDAFLVVAIPWARFLRGFFAAYFLAAMVGIWSLRLIYGDRYHTVMSCGMRAFGFNPLPMFYWGLVWALPFCCEYELHSLGYGSAFTGQKLLFRETFLTPPAEHPYADLRSIELVNPYRDNRAKIGRPPECRLTFADGYQWDDVGWFFPFRSDGTSSNYPELCDFISQQSRITVMKVGHIE